MIRLEQHARVSIRGLAVMTLSCQCVVVVTRPTRSRVSWRRVDGVTHAANAELILSGDFGGVLVQKEHRRAEVDRGCIGGH